jgi:hypothetical protein
VPTLHTYDYAIIRVVPRVEREEFINVGVIVSCPGARHLQAAIEMDPARMRAFAPTLDPEAVQPWLQAIVDICQRRSGGAAAGTGPLPFPHRQAQCGGAGLTDPCRPHHPPGAHRRTPAGTHGARAGLSGPAAC